MGKRILMVIAIFSLAVALCAPPAWSACTTASIGTTANASGALDSADCLAPDSTYYDIYNVTLASAGTLTIDMASGTIDTFLLLFSGSSPDVVNDTPITTDDDSGGGSNGTDAQIIQVLAAGTYTILANSFDVETGSYTLTTSFQTSGGVPDISGTWTVNETVYATACGQGTYADAYSVTVTQSGSSISVATPSGTFSGTLSGSNLSWTGSYPDEGGTTTITSMSVTINGTGTSGSGSASWSWTDGSSSCAGTTDISLTKSTSGGSLNISGTWTVNETVYAAACGDGTYGASYTITVTQSGSNLTVATPSGTFSGTLSGDNVSWTGSYPDEGGSTAITSMSVTINGTGTSGSGNASWSWTDGSQSCSGTTDVTLTKSTASSSGGGGGGGGGGGCFLQQVGGAW